MENNKLIDGAEIITLDEIKHLKLPYFEGLAAGYPSPAELSKPYDNSAYCNNQTITSAVVCC